MPSAVVGKDCLQGDEEEQQDLSGLAASLWDQEPDV